MAAREYLVKERRLGIEVTYMNDSKPMHWTPYSKMARRGKKIDNKSIDVQIRTGTNQVARKSGRVCKEWQTESYIDRHWGVFLTRCRREIHHSRGFCRGTTILFKLQKGKMHMAWPEEGQTTTQKTETNREMRIICKDDKNRNGTEEEEKPMQST